MVAIASFVVIVVIIGVNRDIFKDIGFNSLSIPAFTVNPIGEALSIQTYVR